MIERTVFGDGLKIRYRNLFGRRNSPDTSLLRMLISSLDWCYQPDTINPLFVIDSYYIEAQSRISMFSLIIDLLGKTNKLWKKLIFLEIILGLIFIFGLIWYVRGFL